MRIGEGIAARSRQDNGDRSSFHHDDDSTLQCLTTDVHLALSPHTPLSTMIYLATRKYNRIEILRHCQVCSCGRLYRRGSLCFVVSRFLLSHVCSFQYGYSNMSLQLSPDHSCLLVRALKRNAAREHLACYNLCASPLSPVEWEDDGTLKSQLDLYPQREIFCIRVCDCLSSETHEIVHLFVSYFLTIICIPISRLKY